MPMSLWRLSLPRCWGFTPSALLTGLAFGEALKVSRKRRPARLQFLKPSVDVVVGRMPHADHLRQSGRAPESCFEGPTPGTIGTITAAASNSRSLATYSVHTCRQTDEVLNGAWLAELLNGKALTCRRLQWRGVRRQPAGTSVRAALPENALPFEDNHLSMWMRSGGSNPRTLCLSA
jgi:hypothetical protein